MRRPSSSTETHAARRPAACPVAGRVPCLVLTGLAAAASSGCGLLYDNSFRTGSFTLYSDRSPEFLERTGKRVQRMYEGFGDLFGLERRRLGRTTIVLEGDDSGVIDLGYCPSILGYYVPLFNYICVDTATASTQDAEMLDQVLLHEVSHHFIVTEHPPASSEPWLNEGLAGALEVTVFDEERFEHPLLNPVLFLLAQRAAYGEDRPALAKLLAMSWGEFHAPERKERNYALAWSVAYFLLERRLPREWPLGERIEALYDLDRGVIAALEPEWIAFLRGFDLAGKLLAMASAGEEDRRLTALWAVRQLGAVRVLDELRVLEGLARLFDDPDLEKRSRAYPSFVRKLESAQHSYFLADLAVQAGLARVAAVLDDPEQPARLKEAVAGALETATWTRDRWLPGLVALLDGGDAELRAAAARTLSRFDLKPTVVNPGFWKTASFVARQREVEEWREWIEAQRPAREEP
ncbi:MAG: hypothetical protein HY721_16830 [Planctomycetes bacterium]|nr:hypothetical protein [Planctomycetota bacterium]